MSKEKAFNVKETLGRIESKDIPAVIEAIMADVNLSIEQKASYISQANVVLHQMRILRGLLAV